jgi:hypothetical protein
LGLPSGIKINNYKKPQGELVLLPIVDEDENGKTNNNCDYLINLIFTPQTQ